jgi:hypothetical protein
MRGAAKSEQEVRSDQRRPLVGVRDQDREVGHTITVDVAFDAPRLGALVEGRADLSGGGEFLGSDEGEGLVALLLDVRVDR